MNEVKYLNEVEKFQKHQLNLFTKKIMPYFKENLEKDFNQLGFYPEGRFILLGIEFRLKLFIKIEERTNCYIKSSYLKLVRLDNRNHEEIFVHKFTLQSLENLNDNNLELEYLYIELKDVISEAFRKAEEVQIYPTTEIS